MSYQRWRIAMERALYGDDGFFTTGAGPAAHFRTSVHASTLFAAAVVTLARSRDVETVVDMGAGGGELVAAMRTIAPELRLIAVEAAARPAGLDGDIAWHSDLGELPVGLDALLVANEWLDNVPLDIAVHASDATLRYLEVDSTSGEERLGEPVEAADAEWLAQWWPIDPQVPGRRAEVGRPRDEAWVRAMGALSSGLAVAIDYGHIRADRPRGSTLTAYRAGRVVRAVPDGTCDLTAHVALDSCAAAAEDAGAGAAVLVDQHTALRQLGVRATRPPLELATVEPQRYVAELARAGEAAELLDPEGLGGFTWLTQEVR